jgi:hypothetical protein
MQKRRCDVTTNGHVANKPKILTEAEHQEKMSREKENRRERERERRREGEREKGGREKPMGVFD